MTILLPCFGGKVMAQSSFTPGSLQADLLAQADDAKTPAETSEDRPTLQRGSSGPLVIELQVRLKKLGLFEAEIDGDFDAETLAAVEAFQKDHGLPVDGIVAGMTWKALDSPAAAKISAAIAAVTPEESGEDSEEGEPEPEENADASDPASEKTSLLASPKSRLAILALSIAGIGVGGFGIGKMMIASKANRNRKRGSSTKASAIRASRTQSSATPIASSLALPSAPRTFPEEFSSDDDDSTLASENPLSALHEASPRTSHRQPFVAHEDETPSSAKVLPLKSGSKATKAHRNSALSPASSSALAPSASQGAIEHRRETTELSPTPRLARLDIVQARIGELQSSNPTQRRKAIWELGQRADSRAIQPLVNLMATSDSKQRSLILAALSEIGTQTLKPMKRALAMSLQDANAEVRKNAIRDLTRIYDLVAQISNLLAIATEDQDPEVRETARWALGQLNRIRANAGLDEAPTQQLLNKSVSPPETVSEEPSLRDQNVSRAADLA